jgi:hypothetical protein
MSAACLLERYLEDEGVGAIHALRCAVYPPPSELANFDYNVVKNHIKALHFTQDPYCGGQEQAKHEEAKIKSAVGLDEEHAILQKEQEKFLYPAAFPPISSSEDSTLSSSFDLGQYLDLDTEPTRRSLPSVSGVTSATDSALEAEAEAVTGAEEWEPTDTDLEYAKIRALRRRKGTARMLSKYRNELQKEQSQEP